MTVTVVGLDPSLRRTGLARIVVDSTRTGPLSFRYRCVVETDVRPSTGRQRDTLDQRNARLTGIARDVVDWSTPADLVVIEGPSYGSAVSASAWDRAGLWWRIVAALARRDVPVAVVPPRTRARWATGNGNADKAAVHEAAARLWRPLWTPTYRNDDNESDALVLASMGAQWLNALAPIHQPSREPLTRCEWPDQRGDTTT